MGGEGSIMHMIVTLRSNRKRLNEIRNRYEKSLDKNYVKTPTKPVFSKTLSPTDQAKLNEQIRTKIKREKVITFILTITITLAVCIALAI